jgi:hypothetical protein
MVEGSPIGRSPKRTTALKERTTRSDRRNLQQTIEAIIDPGIIGFWVRLNDEHGEWIGSATPLLRTSVRTLSHYLAPSPSPGSPAQIPKISRIPSVVTARAM